jgi:hypothetical protein
MASIPSCVSDDVNRISARDQSAFGGVWDNPIALNVADTDGVKGSTAMLVTPQTLLLASLTGALVGTDGVLKASASGANVPRDISLTTSGTTGAWNIEDPILVTGIWWWNGGSITLPIYLTEVNGGETLYTSDLFSQITQIYVPGQTLDTGTMTFGCGTAVALTGNEMPHKKSGGGSRGIYVGVEGNLHVKLAGKEARDAPVLYANFATGTEALWIRSVHELTTASSLVRLL